MIATPTIKSFRLGQVVATTGVLEALEKAGQTAAEFLDRHVEGDWGECLHRGLEPERPSPS